MFQKYKELEEITWKSIWNNWIKCIKTYEPHLMEPIDINKTYVNYKGEGYFYGYDWINKNEYQKRVEYISEKPMEFLHFGTSLNKGTLHTLEILDEAKESQEDRAAIWIAAFTQDVLESLPYEWRGKAYNILYKVHEEAWSKINENYYMWHHAMRKLLPEICFSYDFLRSINVNSYRQIIELSVISSAQILNNYIAVEYDSRTK
jgi:hypothetical protein